MSIFKAITWVIISSACLLNGCSKDEPKILSNASLVTIAGNPTQGSVDGQGTSAKFMNPYGITLDANGNIYVADAGDHKIRKITPDGVVTTVAGSTEGYNDGVGTAAKFDVPIDIVMDSKGNLFVADKLNYCIRKITPNGTVSRFAGGIGASSHLDGLGTSARFELPEFMTIDKADNIYLVDNSRNLRLIKPDGTVSSLTTLSNNPGFLDGPIGAARFYQMQSLTVDPGGNLFITDFQEPHSMVRVLKTDGMVSTVGGSDVLYVDGPLTSARFQGLRGIAVDNNGNIYLSEIGKESTNSAFSLSRMRLISADAKVSTLIAGPFGNVDGNASVARFFGGTDMIMAPDGNIYFTDGANHSVRKLIVK